MKKPVIAVDIDEVLVPHNEALATMHNRVFGTNHSVDDYHDDWPRLWGVDRDEAESRAKIWHSSEDWEKRHQELIPGAIDVLKKLKREYKLIVITGRAKHVEAFTRTWLIKHFPTVFDEVHFLGIWEEGRGKTKAEISKKLKVDYLVEDSLDQSLKCAEAGIKVLLFGDYAWNKAENLPNGITRVKDWTAVLEYFANERG